MTPDAGTASLPGPPLGKLVLRTFLWLPPCFAAWYLCAPYHSAAAGFAARAWTALFGAGLVSAVERHGSDLVFVTTIRAAAAPGQVAILLPEVNALAYTYGLALFVALMLAVRPRASKVALGAALLLPVQGFGIAFDFLAQAGAHAGWSGWRAEAVVLGYQAGSLIFPTLVPVLLWAVLNRGYVEGELLCVLPHRAKPPPAG